MRAAFEQGSVDAWAIWEPNSSLALSQSPSHVLANGEGLGLSGPVYTARRDYAQANRAFIHDLLDELSAAEALTRSQHEDSLKMLTRFMDNRPPSTALPIEVKKAMWSVENH